MIDLKTLVKNGVQFGHQAWRWCPKMERFIWGKKNGVHLIDVSQTAFALDRAAKFLEEIAADGKQILWVGTKRPAQDIIQDTAKKLKCPYVRNRWIGGTLTNFSQVKKSVTKLLHYEDILSKTDKYSYTKKEYVLFQKLVDRLESNVGGIRELTWPIGALVVIDAKREAVAIKEAIAAGIPVVALVDTNSDPTGIDFVIPGNDDVVRSISVIVSPLAEAVALGQKNVEKRKKELAEKAEQEKALKAKEAEEETSKKVAKKPVQQASEKTDAGKGAAKKDSAQKEVAEEKVKAAPKKVAPAKDKTQAAKKPAAKKTSAKKKASTAKKADKASS